MWAGLTTNSTAASSSGGSQDPAAKAKKEHDDGIQTFLTALEQSRPEPGPDSATPGGQVVRQVNAVFSTESRELECKVDKGTLRYRDGKGYRGTACPLPEGTLDALEEMGVKRSDVSDIVFLHDEATELVKIFDALGLAGVASAGKWSTAGGSTAWGKAKQATPAKGVTADGTTVEFTGVKVLLDSCITAFGSAVDKEKQFSLAMAIGALVNRGIVKMMAAAEVTPAATKDDGW